MTAPLVDLRGLRLLVVGGGSGIGQSCVRLAADAGALVAATTMPGTAEAVPEAKFVCACDTRDNGQVAAAVRGASAFTSMRNSPATNVACMSPSLSSGTVEQPAKKAAAPARIKNEEKRGKFMA